MKHCEKCKIDVEERFCPKCKSLTKVKAVISEEAKGKPGDTFDCTVWSGPNNARGIRIGRPNRDMFFVKGIAPTIYLDNVPCKAQITDGFWNKCPEIRIAIDDNGNDCLAKWIQKHGLQPEGDAIQLRGKPDEIVMIVIESGKAFKVEVGEGSGRQ